MKLISFEGRDYIDDRMFVLELRRAMPSGSGKKEKLWTLVTKRNVLGFPPTRADDFETWDEAMACIKHVLPQTPLLSLGGKAPAPLLSYEEHLVWLRAKDLRGPHIHPKENSTMPKDWLKRKLTIEQAEAENMVADEQLGQTPVPFGHCNRKWRELIAQMQPGDELWEFSSSSESWQHLCGRGGIALVRCGEVVADRTHALGPPTMRD